MRNAVIVSAARTAVGKAPKGTLRTTRPDELAAAVINAVIERAGIDKNEIEDGAVSYTHLTLPTSDLGQISVVAVSIKNKKKDIAHQTRHYHSK